MEKKYLEDYAAKEFEIFHRYVKENANSEKLAQYPSKDRFSKLHEPMMYFDPFSYNNYKEKIWSQIPFAGTLIISLRNVRKEDCLQHQGFEPEDIPHLIELAKETGKIQFGLQTNPNYYEDLDYLDDVFTELNPPLFRSTPFELLTDENNIKHWGVSFNQLGSISYFSKINEMIGDKGSQFTSSILDQHQGVYFTLKILQREKEIELLENLMVSDPETAGNLFEKYEILLSSTFSSFTPNVNWGLKELKKYDIATKDLNDVFHPEIGSYILKKHVLNPFDYNECRNVIDHYDQNQLYTVYQSLYRSMQNQQYDDLTKHADSVKAIMDNAWNDGKKLVGRNRTIKLGLDVILGACGLGIASLSGLGFVGLFAGLGFHVAASNIPWVSQVSNRILKQLQPDYLVNIYDFHIQKENSENP